MILYQSLWTTLYFYKICFTTCIYFESNPYFANYAKKINYLSVLGLEPKIHFYHHQVVSPKPRSTICNQKSCKVQRVKYNVGAQWGEGYPFRGKQKIYLLTLPNLLSRLAKFKKMKTAVDKKNWVEAAEEMKNSLWYKQVGMRGVELVKRMKNIS